MKVVAKPLAIVARLIARKPLPLHWRVLFLTGDQRINEVIQRDFPPVAQKLACVTCLKPVF
jgi:hypothetical protein